MENCPCHACATYQATISLAHFITQKSLWPSSFTAIQLLFTYQKKHVKEHLGDPGAPKGVPRGPAAALGHLQVDELPSLPWRGHRARSTRRAWSNKRGVGKVTTNEFLIAPWVSYLELEIHGLVAWQGNPLNSPDVFFPSTNLKKRDLQCYK